MKKFIFTISALIAFGVNALAADIIEVPDVYIYTASGSQTNIVVNFSLDGSKSVAGYDFKITLPEGIEPVLDEDELTYTLGDCYKKAPSVVTGYTAGTRTLEVHVAGGDAFVKQSGTLISISVMSSTELTDGITLDAQLNSADFIDYETTNAYDVADFDFQFVASNRVILDEESTVLPTAQSGVNVLVKRELKKDVWNTVCFPYAMSLSKAQTAFGSDVEIADFTGYAKEGDKFTLNFTAHTSGALKVGTPYIIKPKADISEFPVATVNINPTVNNVQIDDEDTGEAAVIFKGTLKAGTVIPKDNVFISGNKFYYSTGTTAIKGFRGYFWIDGFTSSSPAPNFVVDGETTNIEGVQIVNGDGRIYNLNGQHVENPTSKGVYIQNGKKIVMKK